MSQSEKPRRGCMARLMRVFGVFLIIVIGLVIIIQCSTNPAGPAQPLPAFTATPDVSEPTAAPAAQEGAAIPTDTPAQLPPTDTPIPSPPTDTPPPTATQPPADPNRDISFGEPVIFDNSGFQTVAALVTNTTTQVKSFTAKATFKSGDQILATAVGAVNDLLSGQTRAVSMLTTDVIPDSYDSVRLDVDTMIREVDATASADAAMKIVFGSPAISGGDFPMVNVEVTNNDSAQHSMTVQAVFTQGGQLVGVATGAVNELAPGQTKTATLMGQGQLVGDVTVAVETLVQ